jgi:hypothetical protein
MAALKMGFTRNEWCGFSVLPYALRNDVDSSSDTVARFCVTAMEVKSRPLEETRYVSYRLRMVIVMGRGGGPDEPH